MEEKILKVIKTTTVPFPLYIYRTSVTYNEVRKASGIAYIILVLLLNNANREDTIVDVLLKFGIPKDLHYLFGREIANLMSTDIIASRFAPGDFLGHYFSVIRMSELSLTDKGKKMFREGAIPTGAEKVKVKDIFYSPVTRKYDVVSNQAYTTFASSFLGEEFLDRVDVDISGMEDYINANRTKIGLKAEERMISYETEEPQKMQVRKEEGMTLTIKPSGVEYGFETSDETAFFNRYYSSAVMTECLLAKEKYKFMGIDRGQFAVPTVDLSDLENVENIYIPFDITKQAARPCKVFVNRGRFGVKGIESSIKVSEPDSKNILDLIDENAEFALLDLSGCKYYSPYNVRIPCEKLGDILEIQLLVERKATADQFRAIWEKVYEIYQDTEFDGEIRRVILYVVQALNDKTMLERYLLHIFERFNSTDEKIDILLKMNAIFGKSEEWQEYLIKYGSQLFADSCGEIKLDNMIYKNTVLQPLKTVLKINDQEYIRRFAETTKDVEEPELVYQALDAAGFETHDILGVANVVEVYMNNVLENERIDAETGIATEFETLRANLWKLNGMLGIENYSDYTLRDDFNSEDFFNAYSTMQTAARKIDKYKQYAEKEYKVLGLYFTIYEPIHEVLSIEKTSASHPDRITSKYIEEYLARGKYKEAICDLVVKMQYDLRDLLNADNTTQANELIDNAESSGLINSGEANALHKLRMCQNGFQHPERRQIPFDKPTIENWSDIVFSLKGGSE